MTRKKINALRGVKVLTLCGILCSIAIGTAYPQIRQQEAEEARIEHVASGLRPPIAIKGQPTVSWTLSEKMGEYHVPGISIAVIDNGRIAWARGFGVKETGSSSPVTANTVFEAQSISKAVTATAVLNLVSSGRLSLDKPVNDYLKSWKIPNNKYQIKEQVTLRRILSHSSGLTGGGFQGYRTGDSIPTLLQILDGEKPANNLPIRVDFTPGSKYSYSGGGLEVVQQLLIDVTGRAFPELMKHLVLTPAGMTMSTFQEPLPEARWGDAASGHDYDRAVIPGKWPIHPEMACCGLWSTPTDLAKWALAITKAWNGSSSCLLSKPIAAEMLTVQMAPYGLGVEVRGTGQALEFSHSGSNHGFRAEVVMFPAVGKGAVIMANGDGAEAFISNIMTAIASEYHWPARTQIEREVVSLSKAQVDALLGVYSLPPGPTGEPVTYEVIREGDQIYGEIKGLGSRPRLQLFPASATSLFSTVGVDLSFVVDSSGNAVSIDLGGIVGRKIP
jgi:CubicO group peptidase (beta-lactamase class C family)